MRQTIAKKIVLVGTAVAAVALAGCLGCAAQTQQPADTKTQQPAAQEQPAKASEGKAPAATTATADTPYEKKTLAEWVELYPNEGNSYMESKMTNTYEAFSGACVKAFGGEDAPNACSACHAREHFAELYDAQGEALLAGNAKENSAYWSNCTNCHVGDPGDGVVKGGNLYGELTSASAAKLFPAEDYVCGQCHSMFAGTAYLEDDYKGIDQYKYGYEPEEILRAMKEYYEAKPLTETEITAGMVGVPMLDSEIDTVLYMTDACTSVEMFQDGNHQKMGLTCTDCHMPQTKSEDGDTFTSHNMTEDVFENPDALAKCMTCHKSQGIENEDAMKSFVQDRMTELANAQAAAKENLAEFHTELANAVTNDGVDEERLQTAKDAYNLANVYIQYQAGDATRSAADGKMAAMNFTKCMDMLDKADAAIAEGMAALA